MTALFTADWHLSSNPRDEYRHEFVSLHLPMLVAQHSVQQLYVLGDITHERDEHNSVLVNQIVKYLHRLTELCNVFVLRGNHDASNPDAPFFGFINRIRRLAWINSPTTTGMWLFLPHTTNFQRDWRDIDFTKYRLIFCHNTIHGARIHDHVLDGIPVETFKGVPVIAGDIHVPQQFDNVTYVGSPFTVDFGDTFTPRVLLIEDGNRLRSIPCPGRQKRLLEFTVHGLNVGQALKENDIITKANKGDLVKVVMNITREQGQHWPNIKNDIREWGEQRGYQMHMIVPKREADKRSTNQARPQRTTKTDAEILTEYGLAKGLDSTTMKTGHRLLERA